MKCSTNFDIFSAFLSQDKDVLRHTVKYSIVLKSVSGTSKNCQNKKDVVLFPNTFFCFWTCRTQFLQHHLKSLRSKSKKLSVDKLLSKFFFRKCSSGHVACNFDKSAQKFLLKPQKIREKNSKILAENVSVGMQIAVLTTSAEFFLIQVHKKIRNS